MISKELNDWLQVVGLFGVLGGLMFVGLQLRLDRQVALQQSISAAQQARMHWAELIADHSDVWVKGLSGDPLSEAEAAQLEFLATAWEVSYYPWWETSDQLGQAEPERWVRTAALDFYRHPGLGEFWQRHLEFQALTDPNASTDPWLTAVSAELARLDANGE